MCDNLRRLIHGLYIKNILTHLTLLRSTDILHDLEANRPGGTLSLQLPTYFESVGRFALEGIGKSTHFSKIKLIYLFRWT